MNESLEVPIDGINREIALELPEMIGGVENSVILKVRNLCDDSVDIKMVKADCSCTGGSLNPSQIKPNTTSELFLQIRPKAGASEFSTVVNLLTDDYQKLARLRLKAKLKSLIVVSPSSFDLGNASASNGPPSVELQLRCTDSSTSILGIDVSKARHIKSASLASDCLSAKLVFSEQVFATDSDYEELLFFRLRIDEGAGHMRELLSEARFQMRVRHRVRLAPLIPEFIQDSGMMQERVVLSLPDSLRDAQVSFAIRSDDTRAQINVQDVRSIRNIRILQLSIPAELDIGNEAMLIVTDDSTNKEIFSCKCRFQR